MAGGYVNNNNINNNNNNNNNNSNNSNNIDEMMMMMCLYCLSHKNTYLFNVRECARGREGRRRFSPFLHRC